MTPEQNTTKPFTSYQVLLIALLALLQFTVVLDFMVLSPLGDILMKSLNISTAQFGWVVSSYAFSAGASGLMAAGFADKFDRKRLLLFFYTGFIIGTLSCALANNFWTLLAARTVTGLFGGVIGAISLAIVTDVFEINQRGRVMGVVQMGFAASQILGIPIALYFSNIWGWHAPFLMIVVLAVVIGTVVLLKMQSITGHLKLQTDKSAFLHLWHALTNKSHQLGFLATALLSVGGFMMMPFGSAYLINNIKISQEQLLSVFFFSGMGSIVIMPLIGKLSDKYDKFTLFAVGSVIAAIMIVIYTHLPPIPLWEVVVINMIMFMGIMGRIIPSTALTTAIPDMANRGAFMSVNASLQQMAGGIAAIAAGLIVTQPNKFGPLQHYDILGYVVCAAIAICLYLVYKVSQMVKAKAAKPVNLSPVESYDNLNEVI
ncbi:MFS transporter [Mucilaginibacter limnophilus]|uniref:MFS transporter n=1 Tax=Mucilaginibacter limnophilus TaxID=1932778 RepID=A0A3S2UMR0_9SPHI|nr:MFS transporter [Mucilaginibacter limnophilus]RVU01513.1 MFS transporter [Mucilaginibacter limnophilus]